MLKPRKVSDNDFPYPIHSTLQNLVGYTRDVLSNTEECSIM